MSERHSTILVMLGRAAPSKSAGHRLDSVNAEEFTFLDQDAGGDVVSSRRPLFSDFDQPAASFLHKGEKFGLWKYVHFRRQVSRRSSEIACYVETITKPICGKLKIANRPELSFPRRMSNTCLITGGGLCCSIAMEKRTSNRGTSLNDPIWFVCTKTTFVPPKFAEFSFVARR
jgi:hypothetical protein